MRQLTLALVSAFVLASVFVTRVAAESHLPADTAATGTTTGATTVTAVPRAGVGAVELSSSAGIIVLLVMAATLMAFASLWQMRRA